MLFLRINIFSNVWQQRFTYRHRKVFILPMKLTVAKLVLVDPMRGCALEKAHNFIQVLTRTQGDEAMNMLNPTVDCADKDTLDPRIFANVLKDLVSDRLCEERLAVLCRPDKMYPNTDVRHWLGVGLKPGNFSLTSFH